MAATASVVQSESLSYVGGGSDKEYHIYLCDHGGSTYTVHGEYGRRGSISQRAEKGTFKSRFAASEEFNKLEAEKRGKGYRTMSSKRPPAKIPLGAVPGPVAPPVRAPDPLLECLNGKLAPYLAAMSAEEMTVGRTAAAKLAAILGVRTSTSLTGTPAYQPMVALLSGIAFASEGYTDDAVELGAALLEGKPGSRKLRQQAVDLLPAELSDVLDEVLAKHPQPEGQAGLVFSVLNRGRDAWLAR
jgi:predicted DNA-binding WGR domain protein